MIHLRKITIVLYILATIFTGIMSLRFIFVTNSYAIGYCFCIATAFMIYFCYSWFRKNDKEIENE